MKIIGVLLVITGLFGITIGTMMFGDIGVAALLAAVIGLLSGVGFLIAPNNK